MVFGHCNYLLTYSECLFGPRSWAGSSNPHHEIPPTIFHARTQPLKCRREDGTAKIAIAEPQRTLAPGQICALYEGPRLLGGAVFAEIE